MNLIIYVLIVILLFNKIFAYTQTKHQPQKKTYKDNDYIDSILNKINENINSRPEDYPADIRLGEKANQQEVFEAVPNKANLGYHAPRRTTTTLSPGILDQEKNSKNLIRTNTDSHEGNHSTNSWKVFFILCILGCSIIVIHILIKTEFHYLPESIAVIFLGSIIGFLFKIISHWNIADWTKEEVFSPTIFFLVFLPPIIFESGYSMHKGNFFQNIGSICVFAIFGTAISAFVMGAGVYLFGQTAFTYELKARDAFAFGSLVSAVDPVATLAIFNALDVDPVLYMLVFGESILNDAVAIVLTNTIMELSDTTHSLIWVAGYVVGRFFLMFFASAFIGCLFGVLSALLFKYVDLRRTPSLETAFMLIFMYSPYALAEAMHLSGIMAILFAGLVMSHYTHYNLSSVTRISIQQIFRTLSFVSETCVFAYLGMAIFSFRHIFKPSLVIISIVMCLVSRGCNIFPLSMILNRYREHKITRKMQFIMWFSGLRGAIAFALSLNLDLTTEVRHVIVTTTLILVLFTTMILGGGTMPLMKFLNSNSENQRVKNSEKFVFFSKVKELGESIDLEMKSNDQQQQLVGDESDIQFVRNRVRLRGFARIDESILKPFFIRKFTEAELEEGKTRMNDLTKQWFDEANKDESINLSQLNPGGGGGDKAEDVTSFDNFSTKMKKSKSTSSRKSGNKTYHNLNSTAMSSFMLETDDDDDSENEQVVIDKSKFSLTTNL